MQVGTHFAAAAYGSDFKEVDTGAARTAVHGLSVGSVAMPHKEEH